MGKKITLHERLLNLVGSCNQGGLDRLMFIELDRGLRVGLRIFADGSMKLYLSRDNVFPSFQEWATVLHHFPLSIDAKMPGQVEHDDRFYLVGDLEKKR